MVDKIQITTTDLDKYQADLVAAPKSQALQHAVMNNGIQAVSEDTFVADRLTDTFSIDIKTGKVNDQKQSGRCWMFAALSTMRHDISDRFKIEDFELSQNYMFFWDKLEKANYFYQNILDTADMKIDERKVAFLLQTPQQDGGQWDMLCALIEKYGVVPKSAMGETFNSSKSDQINTTLNKKLRKDALKLRSMVANGESESTINDVRKSMVAEDYRILSFAFGTPPTKFNFEYRDKEKQYHIDEDLTPQSFFTKYVNWNLNDTVSIINAPTEDKPFNQVYTVEMLGSVVGGRPVRHFNLEIERLKELTIKQLEAGQTVWFGSDVGQTSDTKRGRMAIDLFNEDDLFSVDFKMSKADQLTTGQSLMTHAMVITGVDLVKGKPTKWKVENSWGPKVGDKGYFVMSDDWFEQYVYQVVIDKKYLTENEQKAFADQTANPIVLAPWDPMGALA